MEQSRRGAGTFPAPTSQFREWTHPGLNGMSSFQSFERKITVEMTSFLLALQQVGAVTKHMSCNCIHVIFYISRSLQCTLHLHGLCLIIQVFTFFFICLYTSLIFFDIFKELNFGFKSFIVSFLLTTPFISTLIFNLFLFFFFVCLTCRLDLNKCLFHGRCLCFITLQLHLSEERITNENVLTLFLTCRITFLYVPLFIHVNVFSVQCPFMLVSISYNFYSHRCYC